MHLIDQKNATKTKCVYGIITQVFGENLFYDCSVMNENDEFEIDVILLI